MRDRGILPQVSEAEQIEEAESFFKEWQIYQKVEENNYRNRSVPLIGKGEIF